jgi:hypothetical protein
MALRDQRFALMIWLTVEPAGVKKIESIDVA